MTYSQKLKDPRWQKKRLEILNRDNFTCKLCGDDKTELNVHHMKYTGDPWESTNEDLTTLCADCHCLVEHEIKRGVDVIRDASSLFKSKHLNVTIIGYHFGYGYIISTIIDLKVCGWAGLDHVGKSKLIKSLNNG